MESRRNIFLHQNDGCDVYHNGVCLSVKSIELLARVEFCKQENSECRILWIDPGQKIAVFKFLG